jgi:hypothetical protein
MGSDGASKDAQKSGENRVQKCPDLQDLQDDVISWHLRTPRNGRKMESKENRVGYLVPNLYSRIARGWFAAALYVK